MRLLYAHDAARVRRLALDGVRPGKIAAIIRVSESAARRFMSEIGVYGDICERARRQRQTIERWENDGHTLAHVARYLGLTEKEAEALKNS